MLFWIFFLYFCYPLLIATFSIFMDHWLILDFPPYSSPKSTLEMMLYTFVFALFILFLLISWSSWNYWCYGGLDRRKSPTIIPNSTLALAFNIPLETIINARDAKHALITPTQSSFTLTQLKRLSSTSPCLYLERVSPLPWKKLTDASLKTKTLYFLTLHRKLIEWKKLPYVYPHKIVFFYCYFSINSFFRLCRYH